MEVNTIYLINYCYWCKAFAHPERKHINLNRASNGVLTENHIWHQDITYLTVVDRDGNAVSWIHSLSEDFGCGLIAKDTVYLKIIERH